MAAELEDTLLIVTADHGHIDNECVNITNYPGICECLDKKPSLEPRVINFFVKRDKEEVFVNEFNKELLLGKKSEQSSPEKQTFLAVYMESLV